MLVPMLPLIYQDSDLLVVNKPSNISLLQDRSGAANLWDQLRVEFGKLYLVHRLDKGTSGVLLVARTASLQKRLTQAFNAQQIHKYYCATVLGQLALVGTGHIDLPLQPGRKSRYRIAAPRAAIQRTHNRWHLDDQHLTNPVTPQFPSYSRVRVLDQPVSDRASQRNEILLAPRTGRTHQLRVHLAWIGYPILGDTIYGKPNAPEQRHERLRLHSHRLVAPGLGSFQAPRPW
jgi:tRNA pseudouridine32 synthase/23S rRNA pseudouridine746 synthase